MLMTYGWRILGSNGGDSADLSIGGKWPRSISLQPHYQPPLAPTSSLPGRCWNALLHNLTSVEHHLRQIIATVLKLNEDFQVVAHTLLDTISCQILCGSWFFFNGCNNKHQWLQQHPPCNSLKSPFVPAWLIYICVHTCRQCGTGCHGNKQDG